jgi:hypothetical protein
VLYHRYLLDLEDRVRHQWSNGESWTDDSKRLVQDLMDTRDLSFDDIEAFYIKEDTHDR